MPCGEDQSPTRSGDVPYPLSRCDESCGCARRVYASPLRILLTVRRIADLEGNGVIGLLETHVLKQILHPERIGLVVLDEQLYLVQVVLGAVGGTSACHSGFGEPVRVLFEKWVHGA
jgi:hypothetical protein